MDNNYEAYKYADIIVRHLKGELSALEEVNLREWLQQNPQNAQLLEKLQNEEILKTDLDFFDSLDKKSAWYNVVSQTRTPSLSGRVSAIIHKWKYAAILLLTLSAAGIIYKLNTQSMSAPAAIAKTIKYQYDIAPGKDGAILTLTNGATIKLDAGTLKTGKNFNGISVKELSGLISYQASDNNHIIKNRYNTITTPLGCKYKIQLPDGSRVWLNSSSSLKFPVAFTAKERRVFLTGEAYFEVAKNKHKPFRVITNHTVVQVLGTHFNVKAYSDESDIKATLLEGSIKIIKNGQSKLIIPGQQASIKLNSSQINVADVNLNQPVAWKNDIFLFDSEDIYSVMRQVSRWYNVQVEYKDDIKPFHFSGSVSRNNNISQILNMLELTGGVHFEIEDRKVIVTR